MEYYVKLPEDIAERDAIVVDPMLATGHSAVQAIRILKQAGVANVKFMCIIASPEGIAAMQAAYPEVDIYCGAEDQGLNADAYIVPGMGDAGDRIFGTKLLYQKSKKPGCIRSRAFAVSDVYIYYES